MASTQMFHHYTGYNKEALSFYFSVRGKSGTTDGCSGVPVIDSPGCPRHGYFAHPDSSPAGSQAVLWGFIYKSVLL